MNTELNIRPIFLHCLKYTKNEALAWQCVSQAWLMVDKTLDLPQQASYMYSKCIYLAKNEYIHRKKYITMTKLETTDKEGKTQSYVDSIEYEPFTQATSDTDLIIDFVKTMPKHLKKPALLVLNGIFENKLGLRNDPLTVNRIRVYLYNVGYIVKKPFNLLQVSNELHTQLNSFFSRGGMIC